MPDLIGSLEDLILHCNVLQLSLCLIFENCWKILMEMRLSLFILVEILFFYLINYLKPRFFLIIIISVDLAARLWAFRP